MRTWKRGTVVAVAAASAMGLMHGPAASAAATDDAVDAAKDFGGGAQHNLRRGVFVAKDLGGGAYWLATTTAVDTVVDGAETGRDAIVTVNDGVIRPAQDATGL